MRKVPDPTVIEATTAVIASAGGPAALAKRCGVSRYAVNQWRMFGIPGAQVGKISTAMNIPPHAVRPDLWPEPVEAAA